MPDFTWLPANQATTEDVEAVFATGGSEAPLPGAEGARLDLAGHHPGTAGTPRCWSRPPGSTADVWLDRVRRWGARRLGRGRAPGEPPRDLEPEAAVDADGPPEGVWSVTCRRAHGLAPGGADHELAHATVEHGEQVGARVLEGYPFEPPPGKTVIWDEASVGLVQVFLEAGYEVVASPTLRRRVVRRTLGGPT